MKQREMLNWGPSSYVLVKTHPIHNLSRSPIRNPIVYMEAIIMITMVISLQRETTWTLVQMRETVIFTRPS